MRIKWKGSEFRERKRYRAMSTRKKFIFSLAITVMLVAALEAVLRLPAGLRDPGRLFARQPDGSIRFVASSSDSRFSDPKPPSTFRIFCFGESTVEGSIYNPRSSFPKLLREMLKDLAGNEQVEVINCGIPGQMSDRVLESFQEALQYQPDLMIVYCGNNEQAVYNLINRVSHPIVFYLKRFLHRHSRIYLVGNSLLRYAQGLAPGRGEAENSMRKRKPETAFDERARRAILASPGQGRAGDKSTAVSSRDGMRSRRRTARKRTRRSRRGKHWPQRSRRRVPFIR